MRRCMGFGLDKFKVGRWPAALKAHEVRYCTTLPAERRIPGCSPRRACVQNTETGSTRVEVPRYVRDGLLRRPVLHVALDQGAIGWQAVRWLLHGQLRMTATEEPWATQEIRIVAQRPPLCCKHGSRGGGEGPPRRAASGFGTPKRFAPSRLALGGRLGALMHQVILSDKKEVRLILGGRPRSGATRESNRCRGGEAFAAALSN